MKTAESLAGSFCWVPTIARGVPGGAATGTGKAGLTAGGKGEKERPKGGVLRQSHG